MIRDAESLAFVGTMPIFDNGNSLFHNIARIDKRVDATSKLTGMRLSDDLEYIKDFTPGMRRSAEQFPVIVERDLKHADMHGARKMQLVGAAEERSEQLLRHFGYGGKAILKGRSLEL